MKNEQASAMVAATLGKAKIAGFDFSRSEVGKPGDFTAVANMTQLADKLLIDAGAGPDHITVEMRHMTLAELQRHADAITIIANAAERASTLRLLRPAAAIGSRL